MTRCLVVATLVAMATPCLRGTVDVCLIGCLVDILPLEAACLQCVRHFSYRDLALQHTARCEGHLVQVHWLAGLVWCDR